MVQPPRPWPKPSPYDDMLSELVANGDIARVREYFDSVFWEDRKERPGWGHLRIALLREDRPMLRLLHTWGAAPTDDDMAKFRAVARDKYPDYLKLLRAAGLRPSNTVWEELPASGTPTAADEALFSETNFKKDAAKMLDQVPQEWRRLLQTFQGAGADEAVIAGGALRDLFNQKQIRDVDIFLRTQGNKKKNKKFLKEIFEAAGLNVVEQDCGYDGYSRLTDKFPEPRTEAASADTNGVTRERKMESWKIVAGPAKTEYNIIFVDDSLDKRLAQETSKREQRSLFTGGLLDSFDVGLCQIACDGQEVVSTPAYRDDVKHQRVSLLRPNSSTEEHLKRVVKKYEGWQLNPEAQKAMVPKPPPNRRSWY
ncbi:MAG: hypothetical protein ACAH83_18705 [Alphaproteobacteria bacterium]